MSMSKNALEPNAIRTLCDAELDAISGAGDSKDTYYCMRGQWYVVHHNAMGKALGCEKIDAPPPPKVQ